MPPSTSIDCRYRRSARRQGKTESAVCELLKKVTGIRDEDACRVTREACEACRASDPPTPSSPNPVVASLLYHLCDDVLRKGGVPGLSANKAARLVVQAEYSLASCHVEPVPLLSCDVVVCCNESTEQAERAIFSVLAQEGVVTIVHLVDDGGGGAALVRRFTGRWNVVPHENPRRRGPFATLHDLLPHLRSEFVAIQDPTTVSHPKRVATAVALLIADGAEILAAPLQTPSGIVRPRHPGHAYRRYLTSPTLVLRRASLLDMGGIAPDRADSDAELIFRAANEGRKFVLAPAPAVTTFARLAHEPLGPAPRYEPRAGSLRHHAIGYPDEPVESDVVIPFHGFLHFLRHSVPSMIEQQGGEAVIHLIDDGTPGGADDVLRYWGSHPRVRTYRNIRNIGQFLSFNNVARYFETRLVTIQDADDVSHPHRLRASGNLLRLADAEIFGGGLHRFHDQPDLLATAGETAPRWDAYWASNLPRPGIGFFLLNPSATMRASTFELLRGFSDYGELDCNKCGLDTEFYARAYYAGARFAISREVVADYRIHAGSATHNSISGWDAPARVQSEAENVRRIADFQKGPFDPRVFGALRSAQGLTERVKF
jgi:Glycosyl transferase family 2